MALPQGFITRDSRLIRRRRELVEKMSGILNAIGFEEGYVAPMYHLGESFRKEGVDDRIKLLDNDGRVLCISDDIVTAMLQSAEGLVRYYGCGEQYKLFGERRNEACFATVIGGLGGIEAEAEIISAGVRLMEKLALPVGKIVIGSSAVLRGVAESALKTVLTKQNVLDLLNGKFSSEDERIVAETLKEIAGANGGITVLGEVAKKISNKTGIDALVGLFELSKVLDEYGLTDKITFDLSYLGGDYDRGMSFAIYDESGNKIMDGGRHDYMNGDGIKRAVSLRVYPDYLLSIHPELVEDKQKFDVVIGTADGIKALARAYKLKNDFADEGLRTTVLYKVSREDVTAFANAFEIEVRVFVDEEGIATCD